MFVIVCAYESRPLCVWRPACNPPPRLDRLVHSLPQDEVVYTVDLGFAYIVFNGAVADEDRVTKSYLARVNFCTMCAGNGKDNVALVCPAPCVGR